MLLSGCVGSPSTPTEITGVAVSAPPRAAGPLRGFSLSPRDFGAEGLVGFFDTAAAHADLIEHVADALEWEEAPGSALAVVHALAEERGDLVVSVGGTFHTSDGTLLRPIDQEVFDRYVAAAARYAAAHRPPFLGFGVEVDTLWRVDPDGFDRFVDLFAAVATAVADVSPETLVFPVFQLERLSGLQGGLFGGTNDTEAAAWDLIDMFPDAGVIGFTSYPGLVFAEPEDVPDDYYTRLGELAGGRPVVITELGWQSGGSLGEHSGSPDLQHRFVSRLPDLLPAPEMAFYVWSFLYDQDAPQPFGSMGMISRQGSERPAWREWVEQRP